MYLQTVLNKVIDKKTTRASADKTLSTPLESPQEEEGGVTHHGNGDRAGIGIVQ